MKLDNIFLFFPEQNYEKENAVSVCAIFFYLAEVAKPNYILLMSPTEI